MNRSSVDELVEDYLRLGGKITVCPPGPGLAPPYQDKRPPADWLIHRQRDTLEWFENYLLHPAISEDAFPRQADESGFAYGELDDPVALEREMVIRELRDLGREADARP